MINILVIWIYLMQKLKTEYPNICKLFWKFSIFPASQNKDEWLFSMVGRNTGALSWNIKVKTIEKRWLWEVLFKSMALFLIIKKAMKAAAVMTRACKQNYLHICELCIYWFYLRANENTWIPWQFFLKPPLFLLLQCHVTER